MNTFSCDVLAVLHGNEYNACHTLVLFAISIEQGLVYVMKI